jgi:hypothetical protein
LIVMIVLIVLATDGFRIMGTLTENECRNC